MAISQTERHLEEGTQDRSSRHAPDDVLGAHHRVTVGSGEEMVLRRIRTADEYRECEALQAEIWGTDDIVGVPMLDLITAQENGGLVIGAFSREKELVGFVYSFPGLTPSGQVKQCSVILGVAPAYRKRGLGYHLKMAQREATLAQGIDLITWTFDPLMSANAYLNLNKLGATSSTYLVNIYGAGHGLNAGLETDRLLVEWRLKEANRQDWSLGEDVLREAVLVNEADSDPVTGLPVSRCHDLDRTEDLLLVQIPRDIQALKEADLGSARAWRVDIRNIFQWYFGRGYAVVGFHPSKGDYGALSRYVLRKEPVS
jgi:predicted GNAT superfamily acetyltransferase